ncbi:MAG: Rid family detoxifying hydrolase [Bacteriovoracia bacterium]
MKIIETKSAPAPVGPYSQAIEVSPKKFLFCSGQIALDPNSGSMVGESVSAQAEQVMKNISAVLSAAGLTYKNIVKSTIFLLTMDDFAAVNTIYDKALDGHKPARSTVAVKSLPKEAKVEIEVIACAD